MLFLGCNIRFVRVDLSVLERILMDMRHWPDGLRVAAVLGSVKWRGQAEQIGEME